jgi:thiol:disulfide interchange protein
VQVLKADWTNADPAITRELARHDRNSVPLYLWYPAHGGEPEILPQVLTPSMLTDRAKATH